MDTILHKRTNGFGTHMQRIWKALRTNGPLVALSAVADRLTDLWYEMRLGIKSAGLVPIETLISSYRDCHDYFPTTARSFFKFMAEIAIRPGQDVFIDYGSGKGRVLIMAAHYRLQRIIGVEISEQLTAEARRNLLQSNHWRRCQDIEIWTGSAEQFSIPEDATIFYLFNPFHGVILAAVLENIRQSIVTRPRPISVIINNPIHFKKIEADHDWLQRTHLFVFEHECIILKNINYTET